MSDTRAAIRELRSLSEKRSLSALSEPEAARWLALRRQLGLPPEPVSLLESAPATQTHDASPPLAPPAPTPVAVPVADIGQPDTARGAAYAAPLSEEASDEAPSEEGASLAVPEETHWTGPALDSPTAPLNSSWVGPALDAPAWSDAASDKPTDPGLEGPPPAPFDEAPAAVRPFKEPDVAEFGGSPGDRVPLAAAADFVSYGREGTEAIDVPTDTGAADAIEQHSLAHLSNASADEATQASEAPFAPDDGTAAAVSAQGETPFHLDGPPADTGGVAPEETRALEPVELPSPAFEGVTPEAPFPLADMESPASGVDEGVVPEAPLPLEATESPAPGLYEGVVPEAPLPLEATESPAPGLYEGVVPEAPLPLEATESPAPGLYEGVVPLAPSALEVMEPAALGVYEGVVPEAPPPLETAEPPASGVYEGVVAEAPPPLETTEASNVFEGVLEEEAPHPQAGEQGPGMGVFLEPSSEEQASSNQGEGGFVYEPPPDPGPADTGPELAAQEGVFPGTPPPLQLGTPLSHALPEETLEGVHSGLAGPVERPPAPSTWEPGSAEPPRLAGDDFARGGDPIGGRGLDPWPEESAMETDDVVETVGDDDLVEVEDVATQAPFPVATPPGSGGIRGFQFPKPPGGAGPTPAPWQRTEPGVPPFATPASVPAPIPLSSLSASTVGPSLGRPMPAAVVVPVPPSPPQRSFTPSGVAPQTPPARPISPAAVAPVTPKPTPRLPTAEVPAVVAAEPARAAVPAFQLRTPVPDSVRPAPSLTATAVVEEETAQPVLELVDEVEPPQAPAATRRLAPTPSPATGTPAVFGSPMMLNPSIVEGDHRVVVHTLEGQVHRGTVHDLDLQDEALAVQQPDGRSVQIPTKRVKAVFFVLAPGGTPPPTRGERVQVTFQDGRQVVGYSDDHATGEPGFFVVPSDARTNTARVYVFRGGVQSITTG
jgi:hypothetical protein